MFVVDVERNKERFIELATKNITRPGLDGLMLWLDNSDFYTAPASIKYHGSYEGGLCEHSLDVYNHLLYLDKAYETNFSLESMTICSLFHDLCKVGCYKTDMRWRKDTSNQWEQYATYKWEEDYAFGGHGSKSLYIVQYYMKLGFDEASAINSHMGIENGQCNAILDAFRCTPLAFLLHTADMASTIPYFNDRLGVEANTPSNKTVESPILDDVGIDAVSVDNEPELPVFAPIISN